MPSSRDLPDPGIKPTSLTSPALRGGFFTASATLEAPYVSERGQYFSPKANLHVTSIYERRRQWHPTPVLLPGNSHGWKSLAGCSPWGCEELDTTERLHFHFSLSLIGEGNGNPLQCSCLESPRDGGAWWAAVYGVAQSRTRLKRLSSSSSRIYEKKSIC